jgi:hypothetical protein
VRESVVLDLLYFDVKRWAESPAAVLTDIAARFPGRIVVRSSAVGEDGADHSMAGAFRSHLDVPATDPEVLRSTIEDIVACYSGNPRDQVLVQPMLAGTVMSGVVMTRDLGTGAPYYVVNYDDESGRTDSVTGGTGANKTLLVYREAPEEYISSPRIRSVLRMVKELEEACGGVPLDIEFALDADHRAYVFQVRRISVSRHWHAEVMRRVGRALPQVSAFIAARSRQRPSVAGDRTILGVMPDWNPAEIIGITPGRLSISLYREIIMRRVWRDARAQLGYRELPGEELMVVLAGHPYVDVRNSFNSLLPARTDEAVAGTLINAFLSRLAEHPELHDKVEFEIVPTCFDFGFDEDMRARYDGVLTSAQLATYRRNLAELTRRAIETGSNSVLAWAEERVTTLAARQRVRPMRWSADALPVQLTVNARGLLDECIDLGSLPFCILARQAFIAEALLRSAVRRGAISAEWLQGFKQSIKTVSTQFSNELLDVCQGRLAPATFLERFGHLRPGTYDIRSLRYMERESLFADCLPPTSGAHEQAFDLASGERALSALLTEHFGCEMSGSAFLEFARRAIAGREYSKFVFSRNLSDALEQIALWGESLGLGREEVANLELSAILDTPTTVAGDDAVEHFLRLAREGDEALGTAHAVKLAYLIRNEADIYLVPQHRSAPNFVGTQHIQGAIAVVAADTTSDADLFGRIVCIEHADPGFDWLFTKGIAGLITKFGGANSHMAIRCAEFGLPAAIGCGEQMFERLLAAGAADLNGGAKVLRPYLQDD